MPATKHTQYAPSTKTEYDYLGLKTVTYAKISLKMVNPRDTEEEEEVKEEEEEKEEEVKEEEEEEKEERSKI